MAVLQALRAEDTGAGAVVRQWERRLVERAGRVCSAPEQDGLLVHRAVVLPEWVDYNGHAHESRLVQVFGDATDALLAAVGIDAEYLEAGGSYYTVETHLSLPREALVGQRLRVTTQLLGSDDKRLHVFHSLYRVDDGELLATAEQMLVHVEPPSRPGGSGTGRAARSGRRPHRPAFRDPVSGRGGQADRAVR